MLQQQDITLIRAALQYWSEEMYLDDPKIVELYSGSSKNETIWKESDIHRLRSQLLSAQLRYAVCQSDTTSIKNRCLFRTVEAATQVMIGESDKLGVVLVLDPAI